MEWRERHKFIFEHLFFPPKRPHEDHQEVYASELLQEVNDAAKEYMHYLGEEDRAVWFEISASISDWIEVYTDGTPCETQIIAKLRSFEINASLLFYLRPQNACLLLRKRPTGTIFECFEVLPKTEAVLSAQDALLRSFPARAVFLPEDKLSHGTFVEELGSAIHKLSIETFKHSMETTTKAGENVTESRQSAHPRLVTEWLFSVLNCVGKPASSMTVCKRTHDDVLWENADIPWRRSGTWLCARVALQLVLHNSAIGDASHSQYKNFILFLMSRFVKINATLRCNLDTLQVLRVKVARRNAKLGQKTFQFVQEMVNSALGKIIISMQQHWDVARRRDTFEIPPVPVSELSPTLSLKHSREKLMKIWKRSKEPTGHFSAPLKIQSRTKPQLNSASLPSTSIFGSNTDGDLLALVTFEIWAAENLTQWSKNSSRTENCCRDVKSLMEVYFNYAKARYKNFPERNSVMLLTLTEFWVALDRIATKLHPLLLQYSPEIPENLLVPLLLPRKREMKRLQDIENYLTRRHIESEKDLPSVFGEISKSSFSTRYFNESKELQCLHQSIIDQAEDARKVLKLEWERMKKKYDELIAEVEEMECGVFVPWRGRNAGRPMHCKFCERCRIEKNAKDMRIGKHEWPLPEGIAHRKAVIFELRAPQAIVSWRDATWSLLNDIAERNSTKGESSVQLLRSYHPLIGYQDIPSRISLASSTKSFLKAHYFKSGLEIDDIFVKSGLSWRLFDTKACNIWTKDQVTYASLKGYCTSKIPTGPYEVLGDAINGTCQTQNQSIAAQSGCPLQVGPHEFVDFGSTRAGEALQWINVLRSLRSSSLNFNAPATSTLIRQLLAQAGSKDKNTKSYLRLSHLELESEPFCSILLDSARDTLQRIRENWKEMNTASVLLKIVQRIGSLSPHPSNMIRAFDMAAVIRQIALQWLHNLRHLQTHQRNTQTSKSVYQETCCRMLQASLLARSTWDFDIDRRENLLRANSDVADYVECSIYIHDCREICGKISDPNLEADIMNDRVLSIEVGSIILELSRRDDSAITTGITRFWQTASLRDKWYSPLEKDQTWLENNSAEGINQVHYNIVTGELLVAGKPLARLPSKYNSSPLYQEFFGEEVMDVFPSEIQTMEYVATQKYGGHQIYFAMDHEEIVIRSSCGTQTFEAVSRNTFQGDIPPLLIQKTRPWMNLSDGKIEFRSSVRPWKMCKDDWNLVLDTESQLNSSLRRNDQYLIDISTPVGLSLSKTFQFFESTQFMHMLYSPKAGIEVLLPRYRLHFFLDKAGRIRCRELSATIEQNQAIDTLHGLQTRLVLRAESSSPTDVRKLLLIPDGSIKINAKPPHIQIKVETGKSTYQSFYKYRIDTRLGQLNAEGNLEAHLYKTYLHAITSSVLADNLTKRTGTEESLISLSDSITKSSVPLSERAQAILCQIAQLTPVRVFYPKGFRYMQTVLWHKELSVFSQRDLYQGTVQEITNHNKASNFLFEDARTMVPLYKGEMQLLTRSQSSLKWYYPAESVADREPDRHDAHYSGRDKVVSSEERVSFEMAALIDSWPKSIPVTTSLHEMLKEWGTISGFHDSLDTLTFSRMLSLQIREDWPMIFSFCRSSLATRAKVTFLFSIIAYGNPEVISYLRTLLAFVVSEKLRDLPSPEYDSYDLEAGNVLCQQEIDKLIDKCQKEFESSTTPLVLKDATSDVWENIEQEREKFEAESRKQQQLIKKVITDAWPASKVLLPSSKHLANYNSNDLQNFLNSRMEIWFINKSFHSLCEQYQQELNRMASSQNLISMPSTILNSSKYVPTTHEQTHFSLLGLMKDVSASSCRFPKFVATGVDGLLENAILSRVLRSEQYENEVLGTCAELRNISHDLLESGAPEMCQYGASLNLSIEAFEDKAKQDGSHLTVPTIQLLQSYRDVVQNRIECILSAIKTLLQPRVAAAQGLIKAGLWPIVTELSLLLLLSSMFRDKLPTEWFDILVSFAREMTALQRIERMIRYVDSSDQYLLQREIENEAHACWEICNHPDWLLLEIQNDMLIRPVQIRVAEEILKPQNGVVLLGMGEGKTSVILPMVITALADGKNFTRVIVLKSLASEMLRTLSQSLSGLVGRIVYHLPFSRKTKLESTTADMLMKLYQQCRLVKGVLLTLPEHVNSFKLIGRDRLSSGNETLSKKLLRLQHWLDQNARDVLDESDEILKPNYELVYTNGEPQLLSGAPARWILTLESLSLVESNANKIQSLCPNDIAVETRSGAAFPYIRVLSKDAGQQLIQAVVEDIVAGRLASLSFHHCNTTTLEAVKDFLLNQEIQKESFEIVSKNFVLPHILDQLFTLRGLFAYGILSLALHKRWLVNYGLDRSRCMSAVPYRAKSVPSAAAEFAQPETMVVLTALSHYYAGISIQDLHHCLVQLLKSPDPSDEYMKWIKGSTLPPKYCNVRSVNLEDKNCIKLLYEHLRINRSLIDYFLKTMVLPREAKEFAYKLSTSAWDLCDNVGVKITSGFSGTCDSRLPLSIQQQDLADLRHTTAAVLAAVLRKGNRSYVCAANDSGRQLDTCGLLSLIVDQSHYPSIIIDVGAQFLDSNQEIASKWLEKRSDKLAAIFFNDKDEKMVMDRDGNIEGWSSSPFKERLVDCIIYLDEFHTRGTDFKLPDSFSAAVLLGPGLQKDPFVQACMRMRKLAVSQSVVFIAPPEVDRGIRSLAPSDNKEIDSLDVIRWTIYQSCFARESQRYLWTTRGLAHSKRRIAHQKHSTKDGEILNPQEFLHAILEQESRPVNEIYGISQLRNTQLPYTFDENQETDCTVVSLTSEWERARIFCHRERNVMEEQEREVLHEVEQQREVQQLPSAQPRDPTHCQYLLHAIQHGSDSMQVSEVESIFDRLAKTILHDYVSVGQIPSDLLITEDFWNTIKNPRTLIDEYLRPVNWILQLQKSKQLFLISPHEANLFMASLRRSDHARLILYSARVTRCMSSFDRLDIYQIPNDKAFSPIDADVKTVLRLFAGQVYFNSFEEYQITCSFLGLWDGIRILEESTRDITIDNFVTPRCRKLNNWQCRFDKSPVPWVKRLVTLRRKGIEWSHTHMGRVLAGRFLGREDFE